MSSPGGGSGTLATVLALALAGASFTLAVGVASSVAGSPDPPPELRSLPSADIPDPYRLRLGPELILTRISTTRVSAASGPTPAPLDPPFLSNVPVWTDPRRQSRPSVATDSTGRIYVAFAHHVTPLNADVYVSWSDDGGATWATPRPVAASPANETSPSLVVSLGDAVTIFYEQDADRDRFAYAQSMDRGATWTASTVSGGPDLHDFRFPAFTARATGAYGAYEAFCTSPYCSGGAHTVAMVFFPDLTNGSNWRGVYFAQDPRVELFHPAVAVNSTGALVGAMDMEVADSLRYDLIWFRFDPVVAMFYQDGMMCFRACESTEPVWPSIAVDGERAVVGAQFVNVTVLGPDPVILANYTTDTSSGVWEGVNTGSQRIDTGPGHQASLSLRMNGSLAVAGYWREDAAWAATSLDGGATFEPPVRTSDNVPPTAVGDPRSLAVGVSSRGPLVAWEDTRDGDTDIYFTSAPRRCLIVVATDPPGLRVSVDGGPPTTAPVSLYFLAGESHTLRVPSPMPAGPGFRYVFQQWSDGDTSNPRTIVVSGDATYTAEFVLSPWVELGDDHPRLGVGAGIRSVAGRGTPQAVGSSTPILRAGPCPAIRPESPPVLSVARRPPFVAGHP